MNATIANAKHWIAQPPLYRVDIGKETYWVLDDKQKDELLAKQKPNAKAEIQRFKGLGEMMPQQLWATTLDPKRRVSLRVQIVDKEKTDRVLGDLMGKDPSAHFPTEPTASGPFIKARSSRHATSRPRCCRVSPSSVAKSNRAIWHR